MSILRRHEAVALPAEVDRISTEGMEMITCGAQALAKLTSQRADHSITFMCVVLLIPDEIVLAW